MPTRLTVADTLHDTLTKALESGRTSYSIAKEAGIAQIAIDRYRRGERSLTLDSASKLCEALGLQLCPIGKTVQNTEPAKAGKKARKKT